MHASHTGSWGPPVVTRPLAIAPRQAAKKNGVSSEERPKTRFATRCDLGSCAICRKAKKAPRRIKPTSAMLKRGYRLAKTDSNRIGKPVQQKIGRASCRERE